MDGDTQIVVSSADVRNLHDPAKKKIYYNAKYEDLHAPLGPAHPFQTDGAARGARDHATGHVETAHLDRFGVRGAVQHVPRAGVRREPRRRGHRGRRRGPHRGERGHGGRDDRREAEEGARELAAGGAGRTADGGGGARGENRGIARACLPSSGSTSSGTPRAEGTCARAVSSRTRPRGRWWTRRWAARATPARARDGRELEARGEGVSSTARRRRTTRARAGSRLLRTARENDHCYAPKRCIHVERAREGVQAIRFFRSTAT